jgi:hypothetical protein
VLQTTSLLVYYVTCWKSRSLKAVVCFRKKRKCIGYTLKNVCETYSIMFYNSSYKNNNTTWKMKQRRFKHARTTHTFVSAAVTWKIIWYESRTPENHFISQYRCTLLVYGVMYLYMKYVECEGCYITDGSGPKFTATLHNAVLLSR